jgi:hypothetical protein
MKAVMPGGGGGESFMPDAMQHAATSSVAEPASSTVGEGSAAAYPD